MFEEKREAVMEIEAAVLPLMPTDKALAAWEGHQFEAETHLGDPPEGRMQTDTLPVQRSIRHETGSSVPVRPPATISNLFVTAIEAATSKPARIIDHNAFTTHPSRFNDGCYRKFQRSASFAKASLAACSASDLVGYVSRSLSVPSLPHSL
jgi:hypothetical protein